jgi:UDP-N-acetylmuramoyl-tripeptide--D-alanyl-D-alanine ligase
LKTASAFRKDAITFGLGRKNDIRADRIRNLGREGITFSLLYQGGSRTIRLKVPGLQNVSNALAAAAVGLCLKVPSDHVVEGLSRFVGLKGRFMVIFLPGDIVLVDDTYNANPSSLKAAFESVKALVGRGERIIVGLGEMMELGESTVPAHQEAGCRVAELGASHFLAIGEHANEMVEGAIRAGMPRDRAEIITTHGDMVRRLKQETRRGDLIFLKGSHKMAMEKVVEGLQSASGETKV